MLAVSALCVFVLALLFTVLATRGQLSWVFGHREVTEDDLDPKNAKVKVKARCKAIDTFRGYVDTLVTIVVSYC